MKWPTCSLDSIAVLDRQSIHPAELDATTPYLGLEHLNGDGRIDCIQTVGSAKLKSNKFQFSDHHVLFGKLRPYLRKIVRPAFSGVCSTDIIPILPKKEVSRDYLFYFLRTPGIINLATSRSTGVNLPRLDPKQLASFQIPLPPLHEQKRIVKILDKADALQAKRRVALAHLDALVQSIFLDMFGNPATNPKGWPLGTLRSLGRVTTGGTPPSAKEGMFNGTIPFITPGDLESSQPIKRTVTEAGAEASRTVEAGATLVCCIGATIGKVDKSVARSAFNQQINAVEWGKRMHAEYGCAVMRFFKPTIIAWGASTTLPILKKSSFELLEIPVPPLADQQEFALRIEGVERLRVVHRIALKALDELFSALQAMAFRGEL